MRSLSAALLLLTTRLAPGHCDPHGEIHPRVTANQDGSFTVTFAYSGPDRIGRMRMMVGADGKELVPRHWINLRGDSIPFDWERGISPNIKKVRMTDTDIRILLTCPEEAGGVPKAKTLLPAEWLMMESSSVDSAGRGAAFVFGDVGNLTEERTMPFKLTWCRSDGFQPARTITLGPVCCITQFPAASPVIWSAGRWWAAWVEQRKKGTGDEVTWATVLGCVFADSGKVERHDLPGISNWNASLDIKANTAGDICVAWHASQDGSYPGNAKIVTAVFTPGK